MEPSFSMLTKNHGDQIALLLTPVEGGKLLAHQLQDLLQLEREREVRHHYSCFLPSSPRDRDQCVNSPILSSLDLSFFPFLGLGHARRFRQAQFPHGRRLPSPRRLIRVGRMPYKIEQQVHTISRSLELFLRFISLTISAKTSFTLVLFFALLSMKEQPQI